MTDRVEMHPDTLSRRKQLAEHHERATEEAEDQEAATAAQVADSDTEAPEVKKPR